MGTTLHLNLAELGQDERSEIQELIRNQFDDYGRVLRHYEESDALAIETGFDHDLDEIRTFFDGVLSERYHTILDKSLHLRALIEEKDLTKEEIQERKGQIARREGAEAIYLSSLTTAGYFDPNGGLRDLLVDMGLNENYSQFDFQPTLEELVDKELLCVFIENDDSVHDATQDVRAGLARHQNEDPINDWFDIRGIGDQCEEIIDEVMANLEEKFMSLDFDRWSDGDDHWVRIYPQTLPQLT